MTLTHISLIALLSTTTAIVAPPFKTTLITKAIASDGDEILVEPIHTPNIVLRPTNSVGRATKTGEALNCKVSREHRDGVIEGVKSDVVTVVLDCDGARFEIVGIQFEGNE